MPIIGQLGNNTNPNFQPANCITLQANAPSSNAVGCKVGTLYFTQAGAAYLATKNTGLSGSVTWTQLTGVGSGVNTINSNAPVANNYVLAGTANQISKAETAGTTTFSLPAAITAPGSLTTTTTLTATLGAITATNGNLVASTSGTGVLLPVVTASGAAGTVNCNGRVGSVTFTGVSIAAAADLTLTIGNTSIADASTRLMLTMTGATTGAALSIKSVTPSAGNYAIVVTNGTGATTTTANITFDFIVLN